MGVCVWEEGVVEVGNSICVVRAISNSELFRIISGLTFFWSIFVARILFFSFHLKLILICLSSCRCLNYSLDKDKIRPQDTLVVISDLASDPRTWRMAWDFVRNNWKILYRKYESIAGLSRNYNLRLKNTNLS